MSWSMAPVFALLVIGIGLVFLGCETRWLTIRLAAAPRQYRLRFFPLDRRDSLIAVCFSLLPVVLSPVIARDVFFQMPKPSAEFDCDDCVTLMYRRLLQMGITSTPMLGKLSVTGEKYYESDHVWLLADIGPWQVPFDWGSFAIGSQYYEGWGLTAAELQAFVEQDRELESLPMDSAR
jgi:hypothetical protein